MPDLNDLNPLVAVVPHGGFPAAGRALDAPQSGFSRRSAGLEGDLGACVLERCTRRIQMISDDGRIDILEERVEVTLRILPGWARRQGVAHRVSCRGLLQGVRAVLDVLARAFNPKASTSSPKACGARSCRPSPPSR